MTNQKYDFQIVFSKLSELTSQDLQITNEINFIDFHELDEIRELRDIVIETQSQPKITFAST